MKITRTSELTGAVHTLDLNVTQHQLDAWERGGFVQEVFSHLPPADREFLMTGITQTEWDEFLGPEPTE